MAFTDKLKRVIKQRAFFFKLFLSITGLICIPLIALQIFLIGRSTNEYRKSTQEMYLSVLQQNAGNFAAQEQILSKVAWRISMDEAVQKPLRRNSTEYSWYLAAEALNNYGTENLYVTYTGVYYASEGYVLADGIKYSLADFSRRYSPETAYREEMAAFFRNLQFLDYYASTDGATLFAALPVSLEFAGVNDAVVFFAIDAQLLEQSYRSTVSPETSFAIVNSQGTFLVRGEEFVDGIGQEALERFLNSHETVHTVSAEGNLQLYKYLEPSSGFLFLLSVNGNEIQQKLMEFAAGIRSTLYIALLLLGILLAITLYINYRPIHLLLEKYAAAEMGSGENSELERLDSAFFARDERLFAQKNLLIDFLFGDLLFANSVNKDLVQQYFPVGRYQAFTVASAKCPTVTTSQIKLLSEQLAGVTGCYVHITRVPYRPQLAIIVLSEGSIDSIVLKESISRKLSEMLREECAVTVGEVVADIYSLRSAYRSSLAPVPVNYIPAEPQTHDATFSKLLQAVLHPLYVGDEEETLSRLSDIERFLYEKLPSETHRKYYGYKLLSAYFSGINISESKLSGKDTEQLLAFSSTQQLFELLRSSMRKICIQVESAERTVDLQLQRRLLHYVDTNFRDSDLCLTTAADFLDTSIYVVSRLFKDATGRGFKDYVTEKRLEYGHMLLRSTKQSIAEISAAAGFENANYFSTVFKLKYGLPPTRFRKNLEEGHNEQ